MDFLGIISMIAAVLTIIGFNYQIIRNFKSDIKDTLDMQDKKFDSFERKFELIENRLFQLAMGKTIKQIMEEEKD